MRERAGGRAGKNQKRAIERAGGLPARARAREREREREGGREGGNGREGSGGGGYGKAWQLAKSLGSAPGENYSRYEFTVGAGLRRAKEEWRNGGNGMGGARDGAADSGRILEAR